MSRSLFGLILAALLFPGTGVAFAADSARGAEIAQRWCANCHVIGGAGPSTAQQGPPDFRSIAALSADQLRTFLSHPHGAMPDLSLTRAEIDNLAAYIATLK